MELLTIDKIKENNYEITPDLTIKQYLSLATKKMIIQRILDLCVIDEDIKKIDFSLKEFAYEYVLVSEYSNIDFEVEDVVLLYDELKEHGIIDNILKLILESEKEFLDYVLRKEIEQIQLVDNSLTNVVYNALIKISEKLPDQKGLMKIMKELPKQFNKIDPSKLKFIINAIGWDKGEN